MNNYPTSYPSLCALAGKKPSKLSQAMHNAAYAYLNMAYTYVAFDTTDTAGVINAMRALGIRGLSLTIPHKEAALGLVDELSTEASEIGALNTVVNENGRLIGYNTDCYGVEEAFRQGEIDVNGNRALIIGAGGAARAVIYALRNLNVGSIVVTNRTKERAIKLKNLFGVDMFLHEDMKGKDLKEFDLLINATPLGSSLYNETEHNFSFSSISKRACVFDLVANETPLILYARKNGLKFIHGTSMLLYQAARQFELFTKQSGPLEVMKKALEQTN
jgi:shikimate dehydrogenase